MPLLPEKFSSFGFQLRSASSIPPPPCITLSLLTLSASSASLARTLSTTDYLLCQAKFLHVSALTTPHYANSAGPIGSVSLDPVFRARRLGALALDGWPPTYASFSIFIPFPTYPSGFLTNSTNLLHRLRLLRLLRLLMPSMLEDLLF